MTERTKVNLDEQLKTVLSSSPLTTIVVGFIHSLGAYLGVLKTTNPDEKSKVIAYLFVADKLMSFATELNTEASKFPGYKELITELAIDDSAVKTVQ